MFTGIIHGLGEIASLDKNSGECRLTLRPLFALEDIADGESIAVNGACLSVERHGREDVTLYASRETLKRTTLGRLTAGRLVNLERALAVGDRLGGHLVSGHVDCLARLRELRPAGLSLACRLTFPEEYGPEVIPKGSVALDGVSLTVNECGRDFLTVNVIPDTQKRTIVRWWRPGDHIHMETDMIGKYVRRLLERRGSRPAGSDGLSREFMLENGFL
ncbi:MAG: riboflavin synthase [Desulfovibrio sp.]|jgi:riboflavin synthase|nr:riboflavin synthase [Desulfovibrio sp.]